MVSWRMLFSALVGLVLLPAGAALAESVSTVPGPPTASVTPADPVVVPPKAAATPAVVTPAAKAPAKPPATAAKPAVPPKTVAGAPSEKVVPATVHGGRVILMKGLANIWSAGIDTMAKTLIADGVTVTVINHSVWQSIAEELIAEYHTKKDVVPIIIIGHSLGADAAVVMSNWLGINGVPVRLIISFDGVANKHPLIGNVQEVINYYKGSGWGQVVTVSKNFRGTIENVDLSKRTDIGHLNIDKNEGLQAESIAKVLEVLKIKPKATAANN